MRALDLFCGIGGVARGLLDAGFDKVIGFDVNAECAEFYPGEFHHVDLSDPELWHPEYVESFDFVWASPPCQRWAQRATLEHPDLLTPVQELFSTLSVPSVIENIPTSPVRRDVQLCGAMFGLRLIRHRDFELHNWKAEQPEHVEHRGDYVTLTGSARIRWYDVRDRHGIWADWIEASGIDWLPFERSRLVSQAIPPAYSRWLAEEWFAQNDG